MDSARQRVRAAEQSATALKALTQTLRGRLTAITQRVARQVAPVPAQTSTAAMGTVLTQGQEQPKIYELGDKVHTAVKGARAHTKQCQIIGARVSRLVSILQSASAAGTSQQRASALIGSYTMCTPM